MKLTGIVWRAHDPRWAFAPASGEGASRHGGRFNAPGERALYTSLRFETAWLEAQQGFLLKAAPITLCGYDVDCEDIADLTDPEVRRLLEIRFQDLACPWKSQWDSGMTPASWVASKALRQAGFAGVVVPSFAQGATEEDLNAVFWRWGPGPPWQVRVIDPSARLPRNALSWHP